MESNPLEECYQMFGIATRRELIALREYLATEQIAAWTANDVKRAADIELLSQRLQDLLERIEQREMKMAIQAVEFGGVN